MWKCKNCGSGIGVQYKELTVKYYPNVFITRSENVRFEDFEDYETDRLKIEFEKYTCKECYCESKKIQDIAEWKVEK